MPAHAIAKHTQARVGKGNVQFVSTGVDQRAADFDATVDDGVQGNAIPADGDLAARDAGDIQQIVDQSHHVLNLAADYLPRLRRQIAARSGPAEDVDRARIGASGFRSS